MVGAVFVVKVWFRCGDFVVTDSIFRLVAGGNCAKCHGKNSYMYEDFAGAARRVAADFPCELYLEIMRRVASIVALILLLTAAAPTMACITGAAMSHEENACCRSMRGQCGEMAKQGCCRVEVHIDHSQLPAHATPLSIHWTVVAHIALFASPFPSVVSNVWRMPDEHSPPGLLSTKTTVLRI